MIKLKAEGELLNYGYLQIPQCPVCGAFISNCSQVRKDNWQCQICARQLKLPVWYKEQPISLDEFQIVQESPKFNRRAVFMVDVSSRALCQMVIPLIEQSRNSFDEIAIIACTPYPTIIEFRNKVRIVTLGSDDQEYQLDIFMNCEKEYQKIRTVCRMLENLCQYNNRDVLKSNYPVEVAQQFLNRLLEYSQIKIIHFCWVQQFQQPPINNFLQTPLIGKNHYHLFIIDESDSIKDYYSEQCRKLHGKCQVFSHNELDSFYNRIEDVLNGEFCWQAQLSVILSPGVKIRKFQNQVVESNIYNLPYLSSIDEIEIELGWDEKKKPNPARVQTILRYLAGDQKRTAIQNIII